MQRIFRVLFLGLLQFVSACFAHKLVLAQGLDKTKVIEFGWDEPNTTFVKNNILRMEQLPFDGLVMSVRYLNSAGQSVIFSNNAFGTELITWEQVQPALSDLKQIRFKKFTDNFLRLNLLPGDIDWFDDFRIPVENSAVLARLAKEGGVKGILFDLEAFRVPQFDYFKQPHKQQFSFEQYQLQVKKRGEEIMRGIQHGYPDLVLFLTFAYDQAGDDPAGLSAHRYGLLPSFLDGLFTAATGKTRIVDGYEASYPYRDLKKFRAAYKQIHNPKRMHCGVSEMYSQRVEAGFGLWMDLESDKQKWDVTEFSNNKFTPRQFTDALSAALQVTDRYVWVYTEQPKWWTDENLPHAYHRAVALARQR